MVMDNNFRSRLRKPGSPGNDNQRFAQPRPPQPQPQQQRSMAPAPPRQRQAPQTQSRPSQQQAPVNNAPSNYDPEPPRSYQVQDPRAKRPKRKKRKAILWILILLILAGGGAGAFWWFNKSDSTPADNSVDRRPQAQEEQNTTIRMIATGDMIAHDTVNIKARQTDGTYDYLKLMSGLKPYFDESDINFCNQSTPAGGEEFGVTGYPVFNAPVAFARGIEELGCNVINIGTNHTNDKGQNLIDATVKAWDDREGVLAVAGANRSAEEQNEIKYFEVKGVKFAFLAYTTYSNIAPANNYGLNMYSDALAEAQVAEAKKEVDFIIVSMRWGTEYSPDIDERQDEISQKLANLGVDVVFGHGPHVLGPVKTLEGPDGHETLVWYSLGNFLNTQLEVETLFSGIAVMDIDIESKEIKKVQMMPIYMHYEWTAAQKQAEDLNARRNLAMYPLDQAEEALAKSQLDTTATAQTERIKSIVTKHLPIKVITSDEF
jgi:poly-gamma-glutamate synthesis protein (capsule biosynthesis protein)